ncbi:hypothetical protein GH741_18675 [Aquibacillus halophilus]|uniref:Uncharacterized protein n=1 Tax=Aquibacillus halophilus TaxID=930132 RepID=A0A6A8DG70_9BACI|nr:hypothetical protein [Aquibacillus halophilus]MRH44675.1 hypothetical protein [Aquibacillus halophilus]
MPLKSATQLIYHAYRLNVNMFSEVIVSVIAVQFVAPVKATDINIAWITIISQHLFVNN